MNNYTMKRCAAAAIREILKYEGITLIYNNVYKTGARTIKVYENSLKRSDVNVPALKERIENVAEAFNFDVKFRTTSGRPWGARGFIIAL